MFSKLFGKAKAKTEILEEEIMAKKGNELWDDFGVSEKDFDKWMKEFQHADIDHEEWGKLICELFPDKKQRVYAWGVVVRAIDQGKFLKEREWESDE